MVDGDDERNAHGHIFPVEDPSPTIVHLYHPHKRKRNTVPLSVETYLGDCHLSSRTRLQPLPESISDPLSCLRLQTPPMAFAFYRMTSKGNSTLSYIRRGYGVVIEGGIDERSGAEPNLDRTSRT